MTETTTEMIQAIQCPGCGRWFQDDGDGFWGSSLYELHQAREHWTGMLFDLAASNPKETA